MQLRMPVLPDATRRRLMRTHVGYTVTDNSVSKGHSVVSIPRRTQSYTPPESLQIIDKGVKPPPSPQTSKDRSKPWVLIR